jgi:hypothetical protein
VLAGEQEGRPFPPEVLLERGGIPFLLRLEVGVRGLVEQLEGRLEVIGARQELSPGVELGTEAVGLAQHLLGAALVIPEAGFLGQRLELADALGLGLEVKDAPRSTGSVRPGRGWRTNPLVPDLEILEQQGPQLDEPQGRLAPRDDGVHARTVAVVRAHAAVAVAIQGRSVAAGATVALASDQVDERGIFCLLHGLSLSTRWAQAVWAGSDLPDGDLPGGLGWPRGDRFWHSIRGQSPTAKRVLSGGPLPGTFKPTFVPSSDPATP